MNGGVQVIHRWWLLSPDWSLGSSIPISQTRQDLLCPLLKLGKLHLYRLLRTELHRTTLSSVVCGGLAGVLVPASVFFLRPLFWCRRILGFSSRHRTGYMAFEALA
jgi:hypothetical protein